MTTTTMTGLEAGRGICAFRAAVLVAAVAACWAGPAAAQKRVALVVGNGAYVSTDPLPNPVNDARAVAGSLERLGFEVQLALDVTRDSVIDEFDRFAAALPGAEAAFFFYSGHGMQIDGSNYLLPVDIEATSARAVRRGSIDIAEVLRDMEASADTSVVVLDACRDNPFLKQLVAMPRTRSAAATRGLAVIKASSSGTVISYAAAAGQTASDGEGDNSPYTAALIKHIETPNLDIALMFRNVAADVFDTTGGEQRPEILSSLLRGFYMNPAEAPSPVTAGMPSEPEAAYVAAADAPPAPVSIQRVPSVGASAAPGHDEQQPGSDPTPEGGLSPDPKGPYADLVERLDLAKPPYRPPAPWTPPASQYFEAAEPNDTFGSATPVTANAEIGLAITPRGDADWVYFGVESGGVLSFVTDPQPAAIDLAIRLLDGDGTDRSGWVTTPRPGGVLEGWFDIARPGAYRLELRDGSNDAEAPEPMKLSLVFAPQEDAYEPNDTPSQAKTAAPDGAHRLNILPRGDADWFLFPLSSPGELNVLATAVPPELDVALRLLDYDQNDLSGWITAPRPGGDTDAVFAVKQPGLYFLEVRDGANDNRSSAAFTLETRFTPSPDSYEPNDSIGAASAIQPSGEAVATIFPRGDADWYSLEVDHPGELAIEAVEVPEAIDVAFRILNSDQRDLTGWIPAPRPGGDTVGAADLPRPGVYFLEVRDGSNDAGSVQPFKLVTRFTPAPDLYEPNDSPGYATTIPPTGSIAFNILPRGDADWFTVEVHEPGELAVTIDNGPENLDLHFRVLNADKADMTGWIAPYSMGGLTEGYADLAWPGAYFIEVRDGANDARSIRHAILSTRFTPTELSYEPNDTFGSATRVSLDGASPAHILPRGEADWHVFYAPGPGALDVTIDEVPEALDIAFRVLNADRADMTGWITAPRLGGVTTGTVTLPGAGWYWMEIRDGSNDARSPLPFRVTRYFRPA